MSWAGRFTRRLARLASARPRLALAATVVLFGTVGLLIRYGVEQGGQQWGMTGVPAPVGLQQAVNSTFTSDRCIGAEDAERMMLAKLDELGLEGWNIQLGPGADRADCVALGMDGQEQEITLFMALGPDGEKVIEAMRDALLINCLTKDEAAQMVQSGLIDEGMEGWEVRTDGPVSARADQVEEVERHVEQGCWTLSTTGWAEDGTRVVWLAGK